MLCSWLRHHAPNARENPFPSRPIRCSQQHCRLRMGVFAVCFPRLLSFLTIGVATVDLIDAAEFAASSPSWMTASCHIYGENGSVPEGGSKEDVASWCQRQFHQFYKLLLERMTRSGAHAALWLVRLKTNPNPRCCCSTRRSGIVSPLVTINLKAVTAHALPFRLFVDATKKWL